MNTPLHLMIPVGNPRPVPVTKSCYRCGQEFTATIARICPSCRHVAYEAQAMRRVSGDLSRREVDVVRLVAQAKLNKEIAHELQLTEGTVKQYISNIFHKWGATNRTEVALRAAREAL